VTPRPFRFAAPFTLLLAAGCHTPSFPTYPDGYREFAYVANTAGNTVTILDLVYLRPDRTLAVGVAPVALAVNPKRNEIYALNSSPAQPSGSVSVIDTDRNAVVATIPVRRDPTSIAVDATGQRAYIANTGSDTVTVLDLDSRKPIATLPTGSKPTKAVISPDGRTLVVTNSGSGTITLYSAGIPPLSNQTTLVTRIASAPPLTVRATVHNCAGASDAVILPDSSKAFIACSAANQVMSIWLGAAPDSWPAKQDSSLLADHVLALLGVGQNPTNLTLKPDGGEVFVSNRDSDSISEIATQTNEVGSTYAIGNRPAHGVVSADNSALYVSNLGAESIALYSIDDGKFLASIRAGLAPDALAFSADEHLLLAADTRSGDIAIIRTTGKLAGLFTILPAGGSPSAIVTKAMPPKP